MWRCVHSTALRFPVDYIAYYASHITHHTSHITHHTSHITHHNVTCWHRVCVVVSWWINHLIAVVYSDLFTQLLWSPLPTISVLRLIRIENHLDKGSFLYSAYSMPRLPRLHPTVNKVVCSCCAAPIIMSS